MSRIGKKMVVVPNGVTANIGDGQLSVKGPKGTLAMPLADDIKYEVQDGGISVQQANDTKRARAFWGMPRTLGQHPDRKSVVEGKRVSDRGELGGISIIKNKTTTRK